MGSVLDGYSLKARYLPALIVVLPLWLSFAVWFPPDKQFIGVFASAAMTLIFCMLLAQIGRDAGKARQKDLFSEWGGPPTIRALAYKSNVINHITLARCHAALRTLVPKLHLPKNEEAERDDWEAARRSYESASDFLREATRDKAKFRLIYAENVNYGFRRNLWAMKPGGMGVCTLAIAGIVVHVVRRFLNNESLSGLDAASTFLAVTLLTLWSFRFTRTWVKMAADEYSSRLVAAAEILHKNSSIKNRE